MSRQDTKWHRDVLGKPRAGPDLTLTAHRHMRHYAPVWKNFSTTLSSVTSAACFSRRVRSSSRLLNPHGMGERAGCGH